MNNKDKIMRFLIDWKGPEYPYRKDIHTALQIKDIDNLLTHLHDVGQIKIDEVQGTGEDDSIIDVNKNYFRNKWSKFWQRSLKYISEIIAAVIISYIVYLLTKKS